MLKPNDPWQRMAVEKQYQEWIKEPEYGLPATLKYLLEYNVPLRERSLERALAATESRLWQALRTGTYAIQLTILLWGTEISLKAAMKLEVESELDLIDGAYLTFAR